MLEKSKENVTFEHFDKIRGKWLDGVYENSTSILTILNDFHRMKDFSSKKTLFNILCKVSQNCTKKKGW